MSQEVKVLASLSGDELLQDIFKTGKDLHSIFATHIWNTNHPEDQITYEYFSYCRSITKLFRDSDGNVIPEKLNDKDYINELFNAGTLNTTDIIQVGIDVDLGNKFEKTRKKAKTTTFGVIYGITNVGLSDQLDTTPEEAQDLINNFYSLYRGVDKWTKRMHNQILKDKYITTVSGRKRRLYPQIDSGEKWKVSSALRMGVNATIQGTSSDMVKIATVKLQPLLKELGAQILMWIHDELLIDVPESIGMENIKRITEVMCNALPLQGVEFTSDAEAGDRWGRIMSEDEIEACRYRHLEESDGDEERNDD